MRQWIYQTLTADVSLSALAPGGGHAAEALAPADMPDDTPFWVYRMGNATVIPGLPGVDAKTQFFAVYVHDKTRDYLRIDAVLARVNAIFHAVEAVPAQGVLSLRYLETSQDFDDVVIGTKFKYCRWAATYAKWL